MSVPIGLLQDNFTDNVVAPAWANSSSTASASYAETGGQAVLTLPSSTAGAHLAFFRSAAGYDLTGDSFSWNIGTMVATGVAATATFDLYLDGLNALRWQQVSNAITARTIVAGVNTQLYTATWSSATYKYLRIREAGGTIFFDSSTNGTTWTNRATVATPFALTLLYAQWTASCGNVASPGSLRLDDVNLILPAPSSTWRETTADWSIVNRFRPVTLASDGGKQGVLVTADSMDSSRNLSGAIHYYGGPLGSASGGYLALTEYASLALAQASPFPIPASGRVDLPAFIDARYMRLYHRSIDASAHTVYEFVPRRIVQADDIEAESINAIHIVAHSITADQISTINLDATARITAGGGLITLDNRGASMTAETANVFNAASAYTWYQADAVTTVGQIWSAYTSTTGFLNVEAQSDGTRAGLLNLAGQGSLLGANDALVAVHGGRTGVPSMVQLSSPDGQILITAPAVNITGGVSGGGLNLGTATGAGTGQIRASGTVNTFGNSAGLGGVVNIKGVGTSSSGWGIVITNSTPANTFWVRDDSVGFLNNTAWTYSSDASKKRNIRTLGKDVRDFMLLEPVRFDYIDGPANRWGYIAQDVQTIMPDLVEALDDGSLGMRTDELIPLFNHVLRRLIRILLQKNVIGLADIA
jgi:hypothetical protein